ncbi:hypothetical protein IQ266_01310 [filamentous cyanobacterium LEGE 11480]|uniref:DUF928 domain-containing protein n=1 Tax=Romeriopsis navalis LEGE 11480 TaxID=2777977 RepID=A0A928VKQ4_9CYAN|nr:hypothetical protein [Romeriopsis navalis]MBE9028391.1 hypothetical protein [Romeriopsis navalis LEGE 11480]
MKRDHSTWLTRSVLITSLGLSLTGLPTVATAHPPQRQSFQISRGLSWGDIMKIFGPKRRSGGSRSGNACIISMNPSPLPSVRNRVASLYPTLIWRGNASAIGLRRLGETRPFWRRTMPAQTKRWKLVQASMIQRTRYNGIPLMPGGSYEWVMYRGPLDIAAATFSVLPSEERAAINQQLKALPGKDEATLKQRAEIYQQAGLGADGLTELFKAENPSPDLKQELADLPDRLCKTE